MTLPIPTRSAGPRLSACSLAVSILALFVSSQVFVNRSSAQPVDSSAEEHFALALKHFEANLFAVASDEFSRFRSAYPEHAQFSDALYYDAESRLARSLDDEAVRLFEVFDERFPRHPFSFQARLALGKHFYEVRSYSRAIETLSLVLEKNPTDEQAAKALYWMGESAVRLNREDEALSYFRRVSDSYRSTETAPRAAYAIAFNQVRLGRFDEAARSFEQLASRYPDSPFSRNIGLALAEVYYETSDYDRTISEIQRRLPDLDGAAEERAIFLLAESYNQVRDSRNAILNYRRFTEGNADNPYYGRALYGLAWNYHHEGIYEWAADNFRLVHEGGDGDLAAESMYYEAVNLALDGRPMEATAAYRAFCANWSGHELADHGWFELGVLLYQQRQWRESNRAFGDLIERYPDSDLMGEALLHRGNTFNAIGEFDDAVDMFDRAIDLDAAPASLREEVSFQKAWLLYRNRDYSASAPEFMQLFSDDTRAQNASEALFWAAESYFQLNDFSRAGNLFSRYIREYPEARHNDAAHYALGWTYFRQREYERAIPEFERFLSAYRDESGAVPYRSDARLRLADSYYALKRYADAVRVYGRMAGDGDDYALYQIGQAYSNAGDAFEAISMFRRLLEEYPRSEWRQEAQYSLGYLYFLNQDFEQAIEAYEVLINDYPRDPLAAKAQYGIGDALFNAGDLNRAVRAYEEVLRRFPNSPFSADAAAGIQFALLAIGADERADAIIDSFTVSNPDSPVIDQLVFRQAEVKYQSGQVNAALTEFQSFIRNARQETLIPEAYFYLGSIYSDKGAVEEASSYFGRLVERYPDHPRFAESARRLGHLRLQLGEYTEAEYIFDLLERNHEDEPGIVAEARYGRSLALSAMGRSAEAEVLLQDAIQAAPDSQESTPAYLGLARLHLERGETAEAGRLFELVVSRSRDATGAEALYLLGKMALEHESPQAAVEMLGRMSTLYAGYPEWMARSFLTQAEAFEQMGDPGEAIRLYDLIISTYPESPSGEIATREKARLER